MSPGKMIQSVLRVLSTIVDVEAVFIDECCPFIVDVAAVLIDSRAVNRWNVIFFKGRPRGNISHSPPSSYE